MHAMDASFWQVVGSQIGFSATSSYAPSEVLLARRALSAMLLRPLAALWLIASTECLAFECLAGRRASFAARVSSCRLPPTSMRPRATSVRRSVVTRATSVGVESAQLPTLIKFLRPHTVRGTILASVTGVARAITNNPGTMALWRGRCCPEHGWNDRADLRQRLHRGNKPDLRRRNRQGEQTILAHRRGRNERTEGMDSRALVRFRWHIARVAPVQPDHLQTLRVWTDDRVHPLFLRSTNAIVGTNPDSCLRRFAGACTRSPRSSSNEFQSWLVSALL